jgi:phage terminase small subunit
MDSKILYIKYSNDRAQQFCIRTELIERADKTHFFRKSAEWEIGRKHIEHIAAAGEALTKHYDGSRFVMNRCELLGGSAVLEYLAGHTLEEELDLLLEQKQVDQVIEKITDAVNEIRQIKEQTEFVITSEFKQVFGSLTLPEGLKAAPVTNIDLIFSNILINDKWNVIDYEWTFFFPIPINYVVFRAIHYYIETAAKRWEIRDAGLYERVGLTKDERQAYEQMEKGFQQYVDGQHLSLGRLYHQMGAAAVPLADVNALMDEKKMQVYYGSGDGFSESNSQFFDVNLDELVQRAILIPEGTTELRVDPAMSSCLVEELKLAWDASFTELVNFRTNGIKVNEQMYLFSTRDPMIQITEDILEHRVMFISFSISLMKAETAAYLSGRLNRMGNSGRYVKKGISYLLKRK